MLESLFTISKPLSELRPAELKTYKITSARVLNFARFDNKICVGFKIHNHTGSTFTYKINDQDATDLQSLEESFENVLIFKLETIGTTNIDLLVKLISINQLKALGALSNA